MTNLPQKSDDLLPDLDIEMADHAPKLRTPVSDVKDVPVRVSAVLGKTKIDIASLRELEAGSIIELDRKVGEPIDLYINDRLIARGELVMVDGVLGVTMTEIVKEQD